MRTKSADREGSHLTSTDRSGKTHCSGNRRRKWLRKYTSATCARKLDGSREGEASGRRSGGIESEERMAEEQRKIFDEEEREEQANKVNMLDNMRGHGMNDRLFQRRRRRFAELKPPLS
jgi:hypothetical protein